MTSLQPSLLSFSVPHASDQFKPKSASRPLMLFCALAVWALGLLAASPQLHAALHADADHVDHSCAVTLFSHGLDSDASLTCLTWAPLLFVEEACPIQPVSPVADALRRLPPGRGPPLR